jgi:hypothetical protein
MLCSELRETSTKVSFALELPEHFVVVEECVREQAVDAAGDRLKVLDLTIPNLKPFVKILSIVQNRRRMVQVVDHVIDR